ncbi:MAG: substrate-binding domain-containing protein, partial [Ligilactobacillus saerimneri]|nr:substrate-binding domain-containing protein [Ligilactobacillus saerimneri]
MRGKLKFIIGILLAITVLTGCGRKTDKVTIVGSSAMQLLAEQAGNDYRLQHKGVNITVQGGGSGTGLSQVQERAVAIGTSDIFAEQKKGINAAQLQDHKIAVIGITPIANKEVGVKNITRTNLQKIFTGKITNWKQVGGHNLPITVINRSKGSGTRTSFESVILPGLVPIKAQEQDSNGAVKKIVASTPGAI